MNKKSKTSVMMEHMTWPDIKKALDEGYTRAIVMAGAVEQHGPYLPLFTDARIGETFAEQIAVQLGETLVAPIIRPGLSDHHMAFPGSFTIRTETYKALLNDYVASLAKHGFQSVILLSAHGGNFKTNAAYAQVLDEEYLDVKVVAPFQDEHLFFRLCNTIAKEEYGVDSSKAGAHAGWFETCQMLALEPELVKDEPYQSGYVGPINGKVMRQGLRVVTPNGIMGDPTGATAIIGRNLNSKLIAAIVTHIESVLDTT